MIAVGAQFIELRFEPCEILAALGGLLIPRVWICRRGLNFGGINSREKVVEHLVVSIAVAADCLNDFRLARLRDVVRRLLEVPVEPRAVLARLRLRALARAEQREDGSRVLPLKTLLHLLCGDHRVVVVRDDAARNIAQDRKSTRLNSSHANISY